jgi:Tfp pilus assembly protein PilN
MSNTKFSQYYDEIGKSLPTALLLTQIYYQPLKGIQKENQAIDTEKNSLLIKGVSSDDEAFTNWISRLEKEKWISNVSITEYGKGKKEHENRLFTFIFTCND